MSTVIEATYDGSVFRPNEPVALKPNTAVKLTVEPTSPQQLLENDAAAKPKLGEPYSFLEVLKSIRLDGPPDLSANLDKYLYGGLDAEEPDRGA